MTTASGTSGTSGSKTAPTAGCRTPRASTRSHGGARSSPRKGCRPLPTSRRVMCSSWTGSDSWRRTCAARRPAARKANCPLCPAMAGKPRWRISAAWTPSSRWIFPTAPNPSSISARPSTCPPCRRHRCAATSRWKRRPAVFAARSRRWTAPTAARRSASWRPWLPMWCARPARPRSIVPAPPPKSSRRRARSSRLAPPCRWARWPRSAASAIR
ncbi:hypothetical protein D3C71_1423270 [compost metagenome]